MSTYKKLTDDKLAKLVSLKFKAIYGILLLYEYKPSFPVGRGIPHILLISTFPLQQSQ